MARPQGKSASGQKGNGRCGENGAAPVESFGAPAGERADQRHIDFEAVKKGPQRALSEHPAQAAAEEKEEQRHHANLDHQRRITHADAARRIGAAENPCRGARERRQREPGILVAARAARGGGGG